MYLAGTPGNRRPTPANHIGMSEWVTVTADANQRFGEEQVRTAIDVLGEAVGEAQEAEAA